MKVAGVISNLVVGSVRIGGEVYAQRGQLNSTGAIALDCQVAKGAASVLRLGLVCTITGKPERLVETRVCCCVAAMV